MSIIKKSVIAFLSVSSICAVVFASAQNNNVLPFGPVNAELPIAPVGNQSQMLANQIMTIMKQLTTMMQSIENAQMHAVSIVIGSPNVEKYHPAFQTNHNVMFVGMMPGVAEQIMREPQLNQTFQSAVQKARDNHVMLFFYGTDHSSDDSIKEMILFCSHYHVIYTPVQVQIKMLMRVLSTIMNNIQQLQIALQNLKLQHLTSQERDQFLQILPSLHFVNSDNHYVNFRIDDHVLNVYAYDSNEGERQLIQQIHLDELNAQQIMQEIQMILNQHQMIHGHYRRYRAEHPHHE